MKKRIAIISPDVMGPIHNGGVGTSCALLAQLLANSGYSVDLIFGNRESLMNGTDEFHWGKFYKKRGVNFKLLHWYDYELQQGHVYARVSYAAYEYLKTTHYDLVIFPDMFGLGYYSMVARQNGLAFENTQFLTSFLGPQLWSKEENQQLFSATDELSIPMLERGSVELADNVQFATQWSIEWLREKGWKTKGESLALFPFELSENPHKRPKKVPDEIVFFGRLEYRKGILEFLDAIEKLKFAGEFEGKKLTFLGRPGHIFGDYGNDHIRSWSRRTGVEYTEHLDMQSYDAINYLRSNDCLAVIASRSETMGYTVIECLANGIPFICSDIAPFKEILGPLDKTGVFQTMNSDSIADVIRSGEYIYGPERAKQLHARTESEWLNVVAKMVKPRPVHARGKKESVSALVVHHERPKYLTEALDSLLAQTEKPHEVMVYDDASRSPEVDDVFSTFETKFRESGIPFKVVRGKTNIGPGKARNLLAGIATGDCLLFMDDDNRALPREIELMNRCRTFADADVVTATMTKFYDGQPDLWMERRWVPVGFDLSANTFENLMGDTNMLIRRSLYEKLGGFPEDKHLRAEDLHLLIRAAKGGARMTLCPEPVFEYRIHRTNRSKMLEFHASRLANLKQVLKSPDSEMEALSHLVLSWSYRSGLAWIQEPDAMIRPIKNFDRVSFEISEELPERIRGANVSEFGTGYRIEFDDDQTVEFEVPKIPSMTKNKEAPHYLVMKFVSEEKGAMTPSNGFQNFYYPDGRCTLTIGLESNEKVKLKFNSTTKRIFVEKAWLVPAGKS